MKVYIKKIEGLTVPKQGSELAAGYDIVATSDPKIVGDQFQDAVENGNITLWNSVQYIEYETNIFIAPENVISKTLIYPRSSISKYNLLLANSLGLVDADYRGQLVCRFRYVWQPRDFPAGEFAVKNSHLVGKVDESKIYKKGDKIAQLVFEPTTHVDFEIVDDLSDTKRGSGGFGSTDSVCS